MATRRGVVYELDADEQKAIDGFRRAIGKAKQMEAAVTSGSSKMTRAYGRQGRELRGIEQAFGRIQRMGRNMLGGLGVGSAGMAGAMVLRSSIRELQNQAKLQETFEREITPLSSLGNNVENIGAVKQELLDFSNAFNRSREEIAAFMFNLQSNASNLSEDTREDIKKESLELAKVTGATLPTAVNLMTKAWQAYGDEVKDANDLQNKLFLTAELGAITFEKFGQFAPDVFQTAKVLGYSFEETLGSIIVATQKLGRTEKALTAVRNVFTRMGDAPEKLELEGIDFELTGSLAEDLKALASLDPQILKKLFGEEALAGVAALASAVAELVELIERLENVKGDLAADREKERLKDPAYVKSVSSGVLDQMNKNFALEGGMTESAQKQTEEFKQSVLGARMGLPAQLQWLAKPKAWLDIAHERIEEGIKVALTGEKYQDRLSVQQSIGAGLVSNRLRRTGQDAAADAILRGLPPGKDYSDEYVGKLLTLGKVGLEEKVKAVDAGQELMPEVPKFLHRLGAVMEVTNATPPGRLVEGFNRKVEGFVEGKLEARAERREEGRLHDQERQGMVRAQVKLGLEPSFAAGPAASGAAAFGKSVVGAVLKPFEGPLDEFHRGLEGIRDVGDLLFGVPDPATAGEDFGRLSGMDRHGGDAGVGRDEERRILSELLVELRAMRGGDRGEDSGMQSAIERQTEAAKELAAAMENRGPRGVRGREMTPRADASSAFAEVSAAR